MKQPTYHFEGPFRWAQHHQFVYVSTNVHLRIVKSRPVVISPSKSYSTKKKKKNGLIKQLYETSLTQSKDFTINFCDGPPALHSFEQCGARVV